VLLIRSIETGDSKILVGVLVAETTTSSPNVEEGVKLTVGIAPAALTVTSDIPYPIEENKSVTGNFVDAGMLKVKFPLLSVNVPEVLPFSVTETEVKVSDPVALFTLPEMVTFCALTIAGSIKKNRAAKRANLFISSFFGQIWLQNRHCSNHKKISWIYSYLKAYLKLAESSRNFNLAV
jgi:hypothetical protein